MAEGFARKYGSDVMHAWSAGLAPAAIVQPLTLEVLAKKNVDISEQFPKSVDELELNAFDVVVNMSGMPLPTPVRGEVLIWNVVDPMMQSEEIYVRVRDQIEGLVMQMILDARRNARSGPEQPIIAPPVPPVSAGTARPRSAPSTIRAGRLAPEPDGERTSESSQRFGFGRVRKNRD